MVGRKELSESRKGASEGNEDDVLLLSLQPRTGQRKVVKEIAVEKLGNSKDSFDN